MYFAQIKNENNDVCAYSIGLGQVYNLCVVGMIFMYSSIVLYGTYIYIIKYIPYTLHSGRYKSFFAPGIGIGGGIRSIACMKYT